ncbi:MAG TPA: hypothetical protein VGF79_16170 [Bacteroidia bacterium]
MPINQDHHIDLAKAAEMTKKFRDCQPVGTIIAHAFNKSIIQEIIDQPLCEGIRIYNAIDDSNIRTVVITGIDGNGNDLYNGVLAEYAERCPQICAPHNPLNC